MLIDTAPAAVTSDPPDSRARQQSHLHRHARLHVASVTISIELFAHLRTLRPWLSPSRASASLPLVLAQAA